MNKGTLFYFLIACLAFCLVACSGTKNAREMGVVGDSLEQKHFLWKVSDENSSVWVLGSLHLADSTLYPLAPVIDSAFTHADELAVELNMNDDEVVKEVGDQSARRGELAEGTLRDLLPEDMWNSIDSLCTSWNVPVVMFEKMRPWYVATSLSSYAFMQTGLSADYGVDYVLLDRAAMEGKAIVSLETAEEQINALADTTESDSAGIYYLKTTLREISEIDSMVESLMRAWKTGNDALLRRLMKEGDEEDSLSQDSKFKEAHEQRVFVNRNSKMAESIAAFLREDRNVFVVVGVAHLALEKDNVIDALRNRGLRVERF
jgi:hypothetical protein